MAFSCRVDGPAVKSVSPMTRSPSVVSTTTKLSDVTDRRLTASAGYDSCVHCHWPSAWWTKPSSASTDRISCTLIDPNASSARNGSSNAAHFT